MLIKLMSRKAWNKKGVYLVDLVLGENWKCKKTVLRMTGKVYGGFSFFLISIQERQDYQLAKCIYDMPNQTLWIRKWMNNWVIKLNFYSWWGLVIIIGKCQRAHNNNNKARPVLDWSSDHSRNIFFIN